jgi:hypothetical protein
MHKVLNSRQRVQQEHRDASLADNAPACRRNPAGTSSKQFYVGEISAKIRMGRRRMQGSLGLTDSQGRNLLASARVTCAAIAAG